MKAVARTMYGSADVLEFVDVNKPSVADDEVLIRVHAAGAGPEVWHVMTGLPYLVRVMGFGLRKPKNPILGDRCRWGRRDGRRGGNGVSDRRCGFGPPAPARSRVCVCASRPRRHPSRRTPTLEQAAVLPTSRCTALAPARHRVASRPGNGLVIRASGGVGTFAVQLAKALWSRGDRSVPDRRDRTRPVPRCRPRDRLHRDEFADGVHRYDLILDTAGRHSLTHLRRALNPHGTLVIVGGEGGGKWTGGFERQIVRATLLSIVVPQRLRPLTSSARRKDLLVLQGFAEAGKLTPVISRAVRCARLRTSSATPTRATAEARSSSRS